VARPRKARREQERSLRKQVQRVERDARELPGGQAERPIEVTSVAVIEPKTRDARCLRCGGELEARADHASSTPRGILRRIDLVCRFCHAPRILWFRVSPPRAN
jgi:hypothetical protein